MVQDFNYHAQMKTRRVGPEKWLISVPIVMSERFQVKNYLLDSPDGRSGDIFKVKESALNYVASPRIKRLARPKPRIDADQMRASESLESTISRVKMSALSYMPSKRILQLARPKDAIHERKVIGS
ncbi:unnamed protein product [Phyllotreta striolata]|uniref:Uncharacterized protein n=1 Tax=Phyllotreta striolata TaxID=444603 RepID=A0A9N9U020_PHYSR|nr:unnamed protein product [Phyllotreta striolata]